MRRKAKEVPLSEITLRKYEKPYKMSKRELVKKLCLSLGLLQPADSRDIIVDIMHLLIMNKKGLCYSDIEKKLIVKRKRAKLPALGITASNIHRQLRRLKSMYLIEKHLNLYRVCENMSLSDVFEERIVKYYLDSIVTRVREYVGALNG